MFIWVNLSRNYESKLKAQIDSFQYPVQVSQKGEELDNEKVRNLEQLKKKHSKLEFEILRVFQY